MRASPGLRIAILTLQLWKKLAELEEKKLIEHWGDEYRRFMKVRDRFMPKLVCRSKGTR